jgi:DNA-binding ferritin-like protein
MDSLITQLRALQFLAHRAHNVIKGPTFFEDHEFLGELYPAYEAAYDSAVERVIGLGTEKLNLSKINIAASQMSDILPNETKPEPFLRAILKGEKDMCGMIDKAVEKASQGTQNLLQGFADQSEARQYQLKQRLSA